MALRLAGASSPDTLSAAGNLRVAKLREPVSPLVAELIVTGNVKLEVVRRPPNDGWQTLDDGFTRIHPILPGCTKGSTQAVAGIAHAGCALAGHDLGIRL